MGSVFKINNTYGIRYDLPGSTREKRKQRQISGFSKKKDAEEALRDIEYKIAHGDYISHDMTVSDLFDLWFRDHVDGLAVKTAETYKNYINVHAKPRIGHIKLKNIRANDIIKLYKDLVEAGVGHSVPKKVHVALRACFYQAYRWDLIEHKIMDKVVCPNYIKKQPSFWDLKEAKEGIKFFNTTAIGFHVAVALNLGLRLGEVCGLKECDIDYNKKVLNIARAVQRNRKVKTIVKIPKTETSIRTLPLPDDMIKLFKARSKWIKLNMLQFGAAYSHEWDGFFSVDELGVILHDQSVGSRYRRLIKKSDLRKITFHDLRHSCASLLLDSGVDMKTIQEILGHADFSTTANIYSHVTNSKKLDALNNINIM